VTVDLTTLPLADSNFDLILSSLAIHNVRRGAGRKRAIEEAVRLLRPGGRLLIADQLATNEYRVQLAALGMTDIARRGWDGEGGGAGHGWLAILSPANKSPHPGLMKRRLELAVKTYAE